MKNLYKIITVLFVSITIVSCNRTVEDTDFDSIDNTLFYVYATDNFLVEEGASNVYNVAVSATAVATQTIPYDVTVDPSSTAVEGVDFEFQTTSTVLSTGETVTSLALLADFDNAATTGKTVVLNLSSSSASVSEAKNTFTLNLIKLCPVNAPFTGDYLLSIVDNGLFDTPTFTPGVVTLSVGTLPTDRVFSQAPYPAFGTFSAVPFNFSLICSNIVVAGGQATGVGCGGVSTTLGPAETSGTFDGNDDSLITVVLIDDEAGASCGADGNITAQFTLTKL